MNKLGMLSSDFSNASILLHVISKGVEDYDMEIAYALDFVAEALKKKADDLSRLVDESVEEEDGTISIRPVDTAKGKEGIIVELPRGK